MSIKLTELTLDSQGRITLPKILRDFLGVGRPGDRVAIYLGDEGTKLLVIKKGDSDGV